MLHKLHIENFGKHTDLTVNFTPGINAIRAVNEAGKSTSLRAIGYCFFGSKALTEPLEDTVTYGLPVSKLKAELEFTHAGVTYSITRAKSGAELTWPGGTVTGQTEVTKFVEALFGVSADMASKLMVAKQKSLGGALSGGPTAAGKMIEDLAGLGLIDELVEAITEQLLAGNTSAAEARVAGARERAVDIEISDFAEEINELGEATFAIEVARRQHDLLVKQHAEQDVEAAQSILADQKRLTAALAARQGPLQQLEAALAVAPPVAPTEAAIAALRAKVAQQEGLTTAVRLHAGLKVMDMTVLWDEPRPTLDAAVADALLEQEALSAAVKLARQSVDDQEKQDVRDASAYRLELQKLEGRLIKETTCLLCQKDLTDVPEVVKINSVLGKQIAALKEERRLAAEAAEEALASARKTLADSIKASDEKTLELRQMQHAMQVDDLLAQHYARAEAFITLDGSVVPAQWTWTGPVDEPQDFAGELAAMERDARTAIAAGAARVEQEKQLVAMRAAQEEDQSALAGLLVADAQETLTIAVLLAGRVSLQAVVVQDRVNEARALEATLTTKKALQEQRMEQILVARVELAKAEADLVEMQANNLLVKKLRGARPAITGKLWNIVLAAVSTYFSDVRGERSVITRDAGIFRVNGNPVSGLSGSAEDALGLAIRFALVKTFLPSIDFVILDEVAAACDDQREVAMLGLLATAGFAQTILVTHSPLADAFSDHIITL